MSVGLSHFAECHENQPVTVSKMLINLLKSYITQWSRNWKSDPESVSRNRSPPKVLLIGRHNHKMVLFI